MSGGLSGYTVPRQSLPTVNTHCYYRCVKLFPFTVQNCCLFLPLFFSDSAPWFVIHCTERERDQAKIKMYKISGLQLGCFTFLPAVGTSFFSHPGQGWLHEAKRAPSWGQWKGGSHIDHSEWLKNPVHTQGWLTGVSVCVMILSMWAHLPRQLLAWWSLLFCPRLSWGGDSAVCLLLCCPTGEVVWKQNPRREGGV